MRTVGENTLPNILAILAGISYEGLHSESEKIIAEKEKYDIQYADSYPLIWNEYERAGYITGFQV